MSFLQKRKNGYYYAVRKIKEGKGKNPWIPRAKSLKTKNKIVARRKFDELFGANPDETKVCYVSEWPNKFCDYIKAEDLNVKTVEKYMIGAKAFVYFIGQKVVRLKDVEHEHIVAFKTYLMDKGKAKSTVSGYMRSMRKMFNVAVRLKYIKNNPMDGLKVGVIDKRTSFFNQDEIRLILQVASQEPYYNALMLFLLQTGFRREEVALAKWSDVNHVQRTIKIIGKGNKIRVQKLPQQTYEAIMKIRSEDRIFGKNQGQIYKDIKNFLKRIGVQGYPHKFRDTYASYSATIMNIVTVRDRLGHSSINQTDKYSHAINFHLDLDIKALFSDWEFVKAEV